jgi:3-hydroxyisobutyrate dehydrogenase-like beta-hydroxyacid dehydrogenase
VDQLRVGILHPGSMGSRVAAQLVEAGAVVWWLPGGRSAATRQRAEGFGLRAADSLDQLAAECSMIISVCPPAAASEVARQVAEAGFGGVYVEANAVSPATTLAIADTLRPGGAVVVDGGITGPPPQRPGTSRLYLSGDGAAVERIRAVFDGTLLEPCVIPGPVGRASALKLAFASYNKVSYVLAAHAYALADGYGVAAELAELAGHVLPRTPLGQPTRLPSAGPRAWRWEPELREIAQAGEAIGVSGAMIDAAADVLLRWSGHKDDDGVTLAQLIADLTFADPAIIDLTTTDPAVPDPKVADPTVPDLTEGS